MISCSIADGSSGLPKEGEIFEHLNTGIPLFTDVMLVAKESYTNFLFLMGILVLIFFYHNEKQIQE